MDNWGCFAHPSRRVWDSAHEPSALKAAEVREGQVISFLHDCGKIRMKGISLNVTDCVHSLTSSANKELVCSEMPLN